MFDTKIEKKEFNVPSFSPSNLRIVKDRKNRYFVFQLECITSIEPFWDDKHKECDVITSFGELWSFLVYGDSRKVAYPAD